jgi:hypothetical protein
VMIRSNKSEGPPPVIEFIQVTDPGELAKIRTRQERARRNDAYWNAHAFELFAHEKGKYVCVAGEQFFVADTATNAEALAIAAHPDDDGRIVMHIPNEKMLRI